LGLNGKGKKKCVFLTENWLYLRNGKRQGQGCYLVTNKKSHKHFHITRKSVTLDDLERSLRTLLC